MQVVHCITGLTPDGAQRMLLRLVEQLQRRGVRNHIVSLGRREPFAEMFEEKGVEVFSLGMGGGLQFIRGLQSLRRIIRTLNPDILQGWMYHANLALSFVRPMITPQPSIVWNIRRGLDDYYDRKLLTRAIIGANARLSSGVARVIYCTEESRTQHEEYGFDASASIVIGNGFDAQKFRPRPEARGMVRAKLAIDSDVTVIGNVGRYDSAKGKSYLLDAFAIVHRRDPKTHLVMVGRGMTPENNSLRARIQELGVSSAVTLYGEVGGMEEIYPAFDVLCSSSVNEGFPNVIAEAMLSGVACVATDVGNTRSLLEGIGIVVAPRCARSLADGLGEMCDRNVHGRSEAGRCGRERILMRYSLEGAAHQYAQLYSSLVGRREKEVFFAQKATL
jgi:glycosyltransferase involved in cell wall biosynthesis